MSTLRIRTPRAFAPLLSPSRYKGAYGGRGSGKSHFFAELTIENAILTPEYRQVCIREVQRSLEQSVKRLLEDKIKALNVGAYFTVLDSQIRTKNGGLIIFQGMQNHTAESIKSLEGYHVAWVEEAQSLSEKSLRLLRPTLRRPGSELWFSWNPNQPTDPVDRLLRNNPPDDATIVDVNWKDNPWFPVELKRELAFDFRVDPDAAEHIWNGGYWQKSDAQVLHGKWYIDSFTPEDHWDGPYYGADWGFSNDPTVLVKLWIDVPNNRLFIEYEAWGLGVDVGPDTSRLFREVPGAECGLIRADNSRPETISAQKKEGWNVIPAPKWSGSIEDGVGHLRSYDEIVIHTRCRHTASQARLYSHKVDRLTGDVLRDIEDKHNDTWDAVRYALSPLIRQRNWRPL